MLTSRVWGKGLASAHALELCCERSEQQTAFAERPSQRQWGGHVCWPLGLMITAIHI